MSQKRKHGELAGGDNGSHKPSKKQHRASKHGENQWHQGRANKTRSRQGPKGAPAEPKTNSTSALKNRIRDLRRLLEHIDNEPKYKMPAGVRIERERELEACEHELAEKDAAAQEADFRTKIIGKYHHIRFFERQKATRGVKRVTKQLTAESDESRKKELMHKLHNAEVDMNYTIYYPLLKPYVSLFPNNSKKQEKNDSGDATTGKGDETHYTTIQDDGTGPRGDMDMWKAVEQAMEEGTLEKLRESKDGIVFPGPKQQQQNSKDKKGKHDKKGSSRAIKQNTVKNKSNAASHEEEEEDSDGGFFE